MTIQFLGQVVLEIFKVVLVDRVQQRFRSRFLSFPIQVVAVTMFSQSRAPQRLLRILLDKLAKGFFALFTGLKKSAKIPRTQGSKLGAHSSSWSP